MFDLLAEIGVPTIVVVTKTDKITAGKVRARLHALAVDLRLDEDQVIPFSAETGAGRDELAEALVELLRQPAWRGA
jgi:GTP-binding protein